MALQGVKDIENRANLECEMLGLQPRLPIIGPWFEKARAALKAGRVGRVGLVATNSIRGGANRRVLDEIVSENHIFEVWSDEPWVIDGAAVRVSLVCFGPDEETVRLDGKVTTNINADLTSGSLNFTRVAQLSENLDIAYIGDTKGGAFDVTGGTRNWLHLPLNPNGRPNADVLRPRAAASETAVQRRAKRKPRPLTPEEARRQPQFKLPIAGGKQGQKLPAATGSPFIELQRAPKQRSARKRK